jgi:hypothetical protein
MKLKMIKLSLIVVFPLWFFSCNNTSIRGTSLPSEITKEIEGEYVFTYNTGQVEVLKVNLDSSYSKVVYPDTASYKEKKDTVLYNNGTWHINDGLIEFNGWSWCNDKSNKNSFLMESYKITVHKVAWFESEGKKPASILVFDEPYYEFLKVSATNSK